MPLEDAFGRSEAEIRYRSLLMLLRQKGWTFSHAQAVALVGGEKRLDRLFTQGKVHATKPTGAANTKWRFDACDIIRYVKPNKMFL